MPPRLIRIATGSPPCRGLLQAWALVEIALWFACGAGGALLFTSRSASAASITGPTPVADPRRIEPVFWRNPAFFIPFQPDPQQFMAGSMREVRLLMSRDGVAWTPLQAARPEVRGFSYRAPGDGEYFFAVQVEDASGRLMPETVTAPQLRIIVDTTKPQIQLQARSGFAGSATLRYDVRDPQLNAESLRIEVSEGGGAWRAIQATAPDLTRADRVVGGVTWSPVAAGGGMRFRVAVSDRAGNLATAVAAVGEASPQASEQAPALTPQTPRTEGAAPLAPQFPALDGAGSPTPSTIETPAEVEGPRFDSAGEQSPAAMDMDGPSLGPAASAAPSFGAPAPALLPTFPREGVGASPSSLVSAPAAQEWPASNAPARETPAANSIGFDESAFAATARALADRPAPPAENAYSSAENRSHPAWETPAGGERLAALPASTGGRTVYAADPFAASGEARVDEASSRPLVPSAAPAASPANPFGAAGFAGATTAPAASTWQAGGAMPDGGALPPGTKLVNTRTFEVEYDVNESGNWGVARVELWGTTDEGATWRNFAVDADNRSPVRVTTPGAGLFGLRMVIHGANAAATPPPAAGERPELYVFVDLHPPGVNLLGAERGKGEASDMLRIRWAASDSNLADRPVTLLYSSHETGPWSTAAAKLDNTGEFLWRLQRHLPERLFLRIEVRDQAGNVGVAESRNPVLIEAPQPVGRLRDIRAASGN